jgi:hypothetical protein
MLHHAYIVQAGYENVIKTVIVAGLLEAAPLFIRDVAFQVR